jgi:Flp pilus assembly pilin Flp
MFRWFKNFISDEAAQDLIEYTLIVAFVALASAALFMRAGKSVSGIWSNAGSQLNTAGIPSCYDNGDREPCHD